MLFFLRVVREILSQRKCINTDVFVPGSFVYSLRNYKSLMIKDGSESHFLSGTLPVFKLHNFALKE